MTTNKARAWIIKMSLIVTLILFSFFLLAPLVGFPLRFDDSIRLIEILLPVFVGYLGSASYFVFRDNTEPEIRLNNANLVNLLIKGPVITWGLMSLIALIVFGYSNSKFVEIGSGISVDFLAGILTVALSLLTVTTNVAVNYLFSIKESD